MMGIDAKTLRKYYREEPDTGHVKANARITESLYRKAYTAAADHFLAIGCRQGFSGDRQLGADPCLRR